MSPPPSWRKSPAGTYSAHGCVCYSVTKSIMLFQMADDMQCTTHRANKVMVLHEEAIAIRVSPPSTIHMRAYMAVVGGEPSRTHSPPSEGVVGECHNISKQTLGI